MSEPTDIRSTIITMLRQKPFNPFTVSTTDGRRLDVLERRSLAINDTQMIVLRNGINVIRLDQVRSVDSI